MSDRFYVESSIGGDSATLTGQEAVHVRRVLRARVGDRIQLFDGSGCEFAAQITELRKETVHCAILERQPHERELARPLVMGVALPKGERQRVLVEKLTELGVTALVPLITERSIVQPDEQTVSRLQRAVIEACKQCGRLRLMQIHFPQTLPEFLQAPDHAGVRLIAHPRADGTPAGEIARQAEAAGVTVAIGPEGGFSSNEFQLARQTGWQPIDLGRRILRVETAAVALASLIGLSLPAHLPALDSTSCPEPLR